MADCVFLNSHFRDYFLAILNIFHRLTLNPKLLPSLYQEAFYREHRIRGTRTYFSKLVNVTPTVVFKSILLQSQIQKF